MGKATTILASVLAAAAVDLIAGWFVMLLWNALIPELFGIATITYWQSVGLSLLVGLLTYRPNKNFTK